MTTTTPRNPRPEAGTDLYVEVWGDGTPVVLVHGSLATGADEWSAQRPLADDGFKLIVPDRRGYGRSPAADGEDFLVDADGSRRSHVNRRPPRRSLLRRLVSHDRRRASPGGDLVVDAARRACGVDRPA